MPRGQCILPTDDAGRILDRLAGLEQVIRPDDIQQALSATGRVSTRSCVLTSEVILWVVLAMGLLTDLPIRQVFKHARRLRVGEKSPARSNLCMARQRLGVAPVRQLFTQVVRTLARPDTPGAFYGGFRLMGFDGTVFDVPDSPANAAAFGRPTAGPRGVGAFPQVKKLSLVELGTHVEVAFAVKHCGGNERAMVAGLLRHLTPEMLLLLDRGFFSYELWREVTATGGKVLARVLSKLILRPFQTLADGSYLAKVYKNDSDRRKDRDGIVVRVIRYTLDDPQRVGHGEEHVLITNLFDEKLYPAEELIILYHERLGGGTGLRRAEDAPRSAACDQAGAGAERDSGGGDPRDLCAVAGPFRDPLADVRGGGDGGPGPGPSVVHRVFPGAEMPPPGMRRHNARTNRDVVSGVALGDARGTNRTPPQPGQPAGDQTEDVEMEEETT